MNLKQRILWLPHNLIAHPLMVFLPSKIGVWLHDITIPNDEKLNEEELKTRIKLIGKEK